jgi:ABC-type multidrug transport system fused ATPase/permease subunit
LATSHTLSQVPQFIIEAVGFGGVIILVLILIATSGGVTGGALQTVLPVLGVYVFAAYRLLPATQHIYKGISQLRFGKAAVDTVYEDLQQHQHISETRTEPQEKLTPQQSIVLEHLKYTYPNADSPALQDINLTIPTGSSVGLVGGSGAGKTTLVDLLLGLLRPSEGTIQVDGKPVTDKDVNRWQQAVGYVPQEIFLADSSIAENIALGIPPEEINYEQVTQCARMAQVHDFIMNDLPQQYDTVAGERGIRLSGGQRQRLGIARALYHEPAVLVLDEATSALDTVTEKAVMDAIEILAQQKTIIIIAHRLSTVRGCDKVVLLEKGKIAAAGSFEELKQQNDQFRSMVASSTT